MFLPDGRRAIDAGAGFVASCAAELETDQTPQGAWRSLPISVSVTLADYEPMAFSYRIDREVPTYVLKPSK